VSRVVLPSRPITINTIPQILAFRFAHHHISGLLAQASAKIPVPALFSAMLHLMPVNPAPKAVAHVMGQIARTV